MAAGSITIQLVLREAQGLQALKPSQRWRDQACNEIDFRGNHNQKGSTFETSASTHHAYVLSSSAGNRYLALIVDRSIYEWRILQ